MPTAGVLLHLILPHSLRCPADAYLTQVAMHYPHLHRQIGQGVAYGHYEEPPSQVRQSRVPVDMQGGVHQLSGYRLVHWSPELKQGPSNHMDNNTKHTALTVAAVLSYYTARSVRLDNESSKLLLLTPHNDTVFGSQLPPYSLRLLSYHPLQATFSGSQLKSRRDHTDTHDLTPGLHEVTPMEIYHHIPCR